MTTMPSLTDTDKMWLSFQLMCAVSQVHQADYYHGDIKSDNIMITSWNWLFLTYKLHN